ncbi:conserved hypothetical protein [Theileria orientalis strain Shintoku]|uniref:Chorein N-terminal domain-containing protein n=1 Tax=Theileria orientalis strain Shintoku TaxID=869250 RepID=J4CD46_THEOR|nr:conserved hypothetical protein [Theileria orientalis strain Shintoku]BAM40507.1 conserved hypothetical protein [Theileria orientalis strain Shintoku]|eukprot:XP_009690808.1 conserved hypothetical protein [Theileria orientalis strain Shintoku]
MLKYILNGLIRTFGRDLVEQWIPLDHVCVTSVGNPEIHLADIAIPEIVFQNYSSPFALVSSNIRRIVVKCDWSAFFRSNKRGKIKIDVDGVDLVVRTKRLDEFDPDLCKKLLLAKKKRYLDKWIKYSKLGANADKAAKIVNCLSIRVKNVKVTFVDDVIYKNPFSIVIRADLVTGGGVDSKNPNMNDLERKGFLKGLLTNLLFKTRGVQIEYNSYETHYSNYSPNYSDDLDTDVGTDNQESDSYALSSSSSNFSDELFESDFSEKEELENRDLYDFLEVKRSNFCTFCSSCMPPEKISKNKIKPDSIKYLNILNTPHKRFKLTTKEGIFVGISVKIWNFNSLFFVDKIAYEPMQKIKLYLCGSDPEYAKQEHYGYLFDGSVKYSKLKLNFSSEFVHTLHDFIRYVRILSSFKKGATNDLCKVPSVQSSVKYCNLLKKLKLFKLSKEDQDFFDAYERETPLGVLIRLRSSLSKKRKKIIKSDVSINKSSKYENKTKGLREAKSKTTKTNEKKIDEKTNLSDVEDAEQDSGIKIERLFQDEDEYEDEYNEQFIRNFVNIQADEYESNFFTSNYFEYMNATIRMALGGPNASSNDDHWFLGTMSFGIVAPNLRVDLIPTSKILNSFNEANRRKGTRRKMLDCIIADVSNFYFNIVQMSDRRASIKIFLARAMCRYAKVECQAKKRTFSCDLVLGVVHNEMLVAAPTKMMEDYEGYLRDYGNEDVDEFSLEDSRKIDKHSLISILIESYGNYVKKNVINMCSYFLIANPALELYKSVEHGLVTRTLNELLSFELFLHRTFTNNHRNQYRIKTTDRGYPFKNVTQYSKEDMKMINKFIGKLDEKLKYVITVTRQRMCMKNRNMVRFTGKEMKMYSFFARFAKKRTRVDAKDMYEQNEQSLLKWPYQKVMDDIVQSGKEARRRRTVMVMASSSSNTGNSRSAKLNADTTANSISNGRVNNDVVVSFEEEVKELGVDVEKINHWGDVDWFYNARSVPFCIESLDLGFNNCIEVSMKGLDVLVDSYLSSKKLTFNDVEVSMNNIYDMNDHFNAFESAPANRSTDRAGTKSHNRQPTAFGATAVTSSKDSFAHTSGATNRKNNFIYTSGRKPAKDCRNDSKTNLLSVELFSFQLIKNSGVFLISLENVELCSNLVVLAPFHQFANEFARSGNNVKNMVDAVRDGTCFPNFYAYFNFKPDYSRKIRSALEEFEYDSMIKVGMHVEMEARVYNMVSCYCTPIYEPELIRFHGDYENKALVSVRDLKVFFLRHDRSTTGEGGIVSVSTNDHTLLYSLVFHKLSLQFLTGSKEKIKLNLKGANLLSHTQADSEAGEDDAGNYEVLFGCTMNDLKSNKITTRRVQHGQVLAQVEKVKGNTEVKLELRSLNLKYNKDFVDYCFQQFFFFNNLIQSIASGTPGVSTGTGVGTNNSLNTSRNNSLNTSRNNSLNTFRNNSLNTSISIASNYISGNTVNNNNSGSTTSDTRSSTEDSASSEGAYQDESRGAKTGHSSGSVKVYVSSLNTFVYLDSFGVVFDVFCELTKKNNSLSLKVARLSTGLLWSNYKRFLTLSLMDLQLRLDDCNVFKKDYEESEYSDCLMDLRHVNNRVVLQVSQFALWYHYNNSYKAYSPQTELNKFRSVSSIGRKYRDLKEVFHELSLLFNEYWFSHVTWCLLPTCSDDDVLIPIFSTKVSSYSRLKPIMNRSYVKSYMKMFLNGIEVVEKFDSLQVDTNLILHRFNSVLTTKGSVEVGEFLFNFDMSVMKEAKQYASEVQEVLSNFKSQVSSFKSMWRGADNVVRSDAATAVAGTLGYGRNDSIGGNSVNIDTKANVATNNMDADEADHYDDDETNEGEYRDDVYDCAHKKGFLCNVDFSLKGSASCLFSDYSLTVPCWYLPDVSERYKRLRFRILKAYPQNKVMVNFGYSFNVLLQSNLDEDFLYKLSKHMDDNVGGSITGEGFQAEDNQVELLYEQYYMFNGTLILTVSNCSFNLDLYAKHPYNLATGVYAQGGNGGARQANVYHPRLSSINVFEEPLDEYELVKIFNLTLCKKAHFVKNEDRLLLKLLVEKLQILDYFGKYMINNVHEVRSRAAQSYYVPEELLSKQKEQIVLSLSKSASSKQVNVVIDNTLVELHPDFINLGIAIVMSQFGSSIQKRGVNKASSKASYGNNVPGSGIGNSGNRNTSNITTGTGKTDTKNTAANTSSGADAIGSLKLSLTLNMFEIWIYPSIDFYTRTKKVARESTEQRVRAIPRIFMTAESVSSGSNYHDDRMHVFCILFSGTVSNNKYCRCHVKYLSTTLGAVLLLESNAKVLVDQNDALIISRMNDPCNRFLFEMKDLSIKFKIDTIDTHNVDAGNVMIQSQLENIKVCNSIEDIARIYYLKDYFYPERINDLIQCMKKPEREHDHEDQEAHEYEYKSLDDIFRSLGVVNTQKSDNVDGFVASLEDMGSVAGSRGNIGGLDGSNSGMYFETRGGADSDIIGVRTAKSRMSVSDDRKGSGNSETGSKEDGDKEKIKKAFKALDRLYYLGRRKISVSVEVSKLQLIILTNPEPMILGVLVNEVNFEVSFKSQQLNTSSVFSLSLLFEVALLNNKFGVIDALMQPTPFGLELVANGAVDEEDEKNIDSNVLAIRLELGAATVDFSNNMSRLMNYLITTLKRIKEIEKTVELNRITVYNELEYDICVFSGNVKRDLDYFVVPNNASVKLFTKEFALLIKNEENQFSNCENLLGYIDNNLLYGNTNNVKDFINLHNYTNNNKIGAANKRTSNVNIKLNDARNNYIYLGRFEGSESILKLPSVGEVVLVEKVSDKVVVSTNVKIENLTDITLVIRCRNYYGKMGEFSGSLNDTEGTSELVLEKFTSVGIPISWYTNKFTPLITYADNAALNRSCGNGASNSCLNSSNYRRTNSSYANGTEYLLRFKNGLCFKTTLTSTVLNDIDEVDCVKYVITIEPTLQICNKLPFDLVVYFSSLKERALDFLVYDKVDSMSVVENRGAVKLLRPNQSWGIPVHSTKFYVKLHMKGVALVNASSASEFDANVVSDVNVGTTAGPGRSSSRMGVATTGARSMSQMGSRTMDTTRFGAVGGSKKMDGVSFEPKVDVVDGYGDAPGALRGEKYSVVEYMSQFGNVSQMNERHLVYQSDLLEINLPNTVDLVATKCLKYTSGPIHETTFKHLEPLLSRGVYSRNKEAFYELVRNSFVNIRLERDKISVFWPYVFENFTDNFISLNGNLIPPHFRYFSTNRQATNASLRAYVRHESGQYVPTKEVSKLDFTSTTATRPPINLEVQTSSKEGKRRSALKDGTRLVKHYADATEESGTVENEGGDALEKSDLMNEQGAKVGSAAENDKGTSAHIAGNGTGMGLECVSLGCTVRALNISAHPTRVVAFHSYYKFINGMKNDLIVEHSSYGRTVVGPNEEVDVNTTLKTIRMLIVSSGTTISACTISLTPPKIPFNMQIRAKPVSKESTKGDEEQLILDISVVEGKFEQGLPCHFNGLYIIVSEAKDTTYQLLNLTRADLYVVDPNFLPENSQCESIRRMEILESDNTMVLSRLRLTPHVLFNNNDRRVAFKASEDSDWMIYNIDTLKNVHTYKTTTNTSVKFKERLEIFVSCIMKKNGTRVICFVDNYILLCKLIERVDLVQMNRITSVWSKIVFTFATPRITTTMSSKKKLVLAAHLNSLQFNLVLTNNFHLANLSNVNGATSAKSTKFTLSGSNDWIMDLTLTINGCHIDHFVQGFIPVILKTLTNRHSVQESFLVFKTTCTIFSKSIQTFDNVYFKLSPISMNVEMRVIEQIVDYFESISADNLNTAYKAKSGSMSSTSMSRTGSRRGVTDVRVGTTGGDKDNRALGVGGRHGEATASGRSDTDGDRPVSAGYDTVVKISTNKLGTVGHGTSGGDAYFRGHSGLRVARAEAARKQAGGPVASVVKLNKSDKMTKKYFKRLTIEPITVVLAIRTSDVRLTRQGLQILDALPVDTPSVCVHFFSEKIYQNVCSFEELFSILKNSYFKQLVRQSLPTAWLSNSLALLYGVIKGFLYLVTQPFSCCKKFKNTFEGFLIGINNGIKYFVLFVVGGLAQSVGHLLNIFYKLMGRGRAKPIGILDGLWFGLNSVFLDMFYNPWRRLFSEFYIGTGVRRGFRNAYNVVKCLASPLTALVNLLVNIVEGLSNVLLGDFEQFTHLYETDQLSSIASTGERLKVDPGDDKKRGELLRKMKTVGRLF